MEKVYEFTNKEEKIQEQETLKLMKKYNNASPEYFDRLKNLYKRRNYLVLISRIETESERLICLEKIKGDPTKLYSEIVWERNIEYDINYYLESQNFTLKDKGTKYLSKLIETLYNERRLYNDMETDEFNYFDLDDFNNIHYQYFDEDKALVISEIKKAIVNSSPNSISLSINNIVYNGVNEILDYKDENKKIKKYKK